ncbi:DUF378 domain-containing protein [Bacillus thuringiensis]|jgi:uncharacterized protein|uniref:DUF378 domain-containing protein n=6 Tax=Bacillus cereus group TaxID=86661 RepID=A0A9W7UNX2_BACCE|nr:MULTISPECIES: DUF378 domain-containing protein [Bacillus]MED1158721.1 DUF378 domain-containing protein [Bacillus paranthracis]AFQ26318.1 hypothetical protein BTF1_10595 [Bacillus thuringiensis HD-789]AJH08622.1 hypothetical protein AS86_1379 [Bacillus thuringiensis HD1002]AND24457.1 hypothetical protein ATN07_13075 [Bacillus thuringiensis serovar israelensis]EEM98817.1 hypothetical protein bthur0014_65900 [Bacillus thuringiensis IBL 4222]
MKTIQRIALALIIIGAINWGLIGFFKFDLVAAIFGGQGAFLSRVVFALVGLSGLMCITLLFQLMRDVNQDFNYNKSTEINYGTEFGEETDIVDLRESSNQNYTSKQRNSLDD